VAQQENAPNKPVHLMFLTGAIVAFYLTQWTIEWIWGYFAAAPSELVVTAIGGVVTLVAAVTLYRNDRVYQLATEVASELGKVTWPTAKEVRAATIVVVVMAVISALILGVFDLVWSQLTEVVYG
jgi:preprotein translocase subunit SecE